MAIFSWNEKSIGAKTLAVNLNIPRIKHSGSRFKGTPTKTVINWGATELPKEVEKCNIINPPDRVGIATNKLKFLKLCKEAKVRVPPFSTDPSVAKKWIEGGRIAVCRTILNSSGGKGIVLAEDVGSIVKAPLYTKYIPKQEEYRIHCVRKKEGCEVFDYQRKAKKLDSDNETWKIRNLENGFIYARADARPPKDVLDQALAAFAATNLHFGAVDVVWNNSSEKAYVLEINTAPGLEGQTLENYKKIFIYFFS